MDQGDLDNSKPAHINDARRSRSTADSNDLINKTKSFENRISGNSRGSLRPTSRFLNIEEEQQQPIEMPEKPQFGQETNTLTDSNRLYISARISSEHSLNC